MHDNASVAEVVRGVALPRTTVFRILAVLERLDFVARSGDRGRYRLAIRVRELADGYDDESWVADIARPRVQALGDEFALPRAAGHADGLDDAVAGRDRSQQCNSAGPSLPHRLAHGADRERATGHVYLAACTARQRAAVLDLVGTLREYSARRTFDRRRIEAAVERVRQQGDPRSTRPLGRETALAVPVLANGSYLASLAVRYPRGAFGEDEARRRFLAPLRATAASIGREFAAQAGLRQVAVRR